MDNISSFRDLIAWQKAMDLADLVYDVTETFPKREWFGLAQMRKSVVSIPSNIAEGHRRRTPRYAYHLEVALGSHGELDTQTEIRRPAAVHSGRSQTSGRSHRGGRPNNERPLSLD